jgi:hypothetical protein
MAEPLSVDLRERIVAAIKGNVAARSGDPFSDDLLMHWS